MVHARRGWVLGLVGLLLVFAQPAWAAVSLSFDQVDYLQPDFSPADVPDSEWGQFNVEYEQGSDLEWLNVVVDAGSGGARWVVQNHPLLPRDLTDTPDFSSTGYFDLGVSRGTDVSSLSNVLVNLSSSPLPDLPMSGDLLPNVPVGASQNIINNGVPSGVLALNVATAPLLNWNVPFANVMIGWHQGMPNVVQPLNYCGPGAAANSLHWLAGQHGFQLNESLATTQNTLATAMNNNNRGNWDDKEVEGKLQYIANKRLPLEVHYTGGVQLPRRGDFVDPNGNGTARNDGAVTWEWLQREFKRGQDIELMTNTHWVVMEGLISWGDLHLVSYRDDPFQRGGATTDAQRRIINGRHVWTTFQGGTINIGNGNERLQAAVAESFVPEPGSALLLSLGLAGVGLRRRFGRR